MNRYAIIGGGRLARHLHHYLSLLDIPNSVWARDAQCSINSSTLPDAKQRLRHVVDPTTHIILAVSDAAITEVLKQYPFLYKKTLIHCSGAFSFPSVAGVHPLMTFAHELYPLEIYQQVPFMVEAGHNFATLFPALANPHHVIPLEEKARYHAFCVMAGNFSQILWQMASERFVSMGLPATSLHPYLRQVVENFINNPESSLTGPLSRGDHLTIARNLSALKGDPLQRLYQSYIEQHQLQQTNEWPREAQL